MTRQINQLEVVGWIKYVNTPWGYMITLAPREDYNYR